MNTNKWKSLFFLLSGVFTSNLYFIGLNAGVFGAQVISVLLVMALTCWAILAD
ncbi:hypothetical protein [Actinobacillus vicugnae]|uniref:hypothetical protein n=1 Tax=Actinobacillus vicugnae TaxID=2573093 RepID=UPI00142EAD44|nr:hypothetical protein [Actinobacillus vicugnae]